MMSRSGAQRLRLPTWNRKVAVTGAPGRGRSERGDRPRGSRSQREPGPAGVSAAFYAAIVLLLLVYLSRLDLSTIESIHLSWGWLVGALLAGLFHRLTIPWVWVLLLQSMGAQVRNYPAYNFVYAKAWLGRYIPGKVALIAARMYFAEELGVSRAAIGVSSIAEIGAHLWMGGTIGLLGVASLSGANEAIASYRLIAYVLVGLLAVGLVPPIFNRAMWVVFRLARRDTGGRPRVKAGTLAVAVSGLGVASLGTAGMAIMVATSVDPVALDHVFFVWGSYSLAGVLGMAFIFTPSGIGAREAVLVSLFNLVFAPEASLAIVVLSRLGEVAADGLFYGVSAGWASLAARRRGP